MAGNTNEGQTTWVNTYFADSTHQMLGTVGEIHYIIGTWTEDKSATVAVNYHTPDTFYSTGSETVNPSQGFIPNEGICISLAVPTSTILGGVLAEECTGGQYMTGINSTTGGINCDTP